MTNSDPPAEVVLPAEPLAPTCEFFVERLGFQLRTIFPADAPRVAVLDGPGLRVRLDARHTGAPGLLRLPRVEGLAPEGTRAPNGTHIEWQTPAGHLHVPALVPDLVLQYPSDPSAWSRGRAGMGYRDLLPGRLGGHTVASHIRIADCGPVPDYVHHHGVRFQIIYCHRGRVRVVYQDQGEPFWMEPGDCVLQPPGIRHRVLESSDGLELIEVGCPAEHETCTDPTLELPNGPARPGLEYGGQRFVRSCAEHASWEVDEACGLALRDTGIAEASDGVTSVRVLRPVGDAREIDLTGDDPLQFFYVLSGSATVLIDDAELTLGPDACCTVPAGTPTALVSSSADLSLLEVTA